MAETPLLIAGLGNPGADYAHKRDNEEIIAVDVIHESNRFGRRRGSVTGLISEGTRRGRETYLLKPMTYMNASGDCVGTAVRYFRLPLSALVVMHNEMDLADA